MATLWSVQHQGQQIAVLGSAREALEFVVDKRLTDPLVLLGRTIEARLLPNVIIDEFDTEDNAPDTKGD
ncbi:MAG: hypothetical protein ACR2RF_26230 [Geminicoccaceae bacterium]